MYLAIGYNLLEEEAKLQKTRQKFQHRALIYFAKSVNEDSLDYLGRYYLARHSAECRQVSILTQPCQGSCYNSVNNLEIY